MVHQPVLSIIRIPQINQGAYTSSKIKFQNFSKTLKIVLYKSKHRLTFISLLAGHLLP